MKTIKPYILPRPFGGFNIPISIQSIYLKEYSLSNNYTFSLPTVEMTTSNSFIKLESILKSGFQASLDISIVSLFVLPIENMTILQKIFSDYKNNNNIKLHILLEKKILSVNELLVWAQDTGSIRKLIPSYSDVKELLKDFKI